jgi:hypothetical protein
MRKLFITLQRPNFLNSLYLAFSFNTSLNRQFATSLPFATDFDAIRSDWETVGNDMKWALQEFSRQKEMARGQQG